MPPKSGTDLTSRGDDDDPDKYKSTRYNQVNADVEDIYRQWDELVNEEQLRELSRIVRDLAADPPADGKALEHQLMLHRKRMRRADTFRKAQLLHAYHCLVSRGELEANPHLHSLLVKKSSKSQSGVLVITVLTSPYPTFTEPESGKKATSHSPRTRPHFLDTHFRESLPRHAPEHRGYIADARIVLSSAGSPGQAALLSPPGSFRDPSLTLLGTLLLAR